MTTTARTADGNGSGWACAGAVALEGHRPRRRDAHRLRQGAAHARRQAARSRRLPGGARARRRRGPARPCCASISARADEGRSAFSKPGGGSRVGEKMLGALTLRSDPWSALDPSAPFDDEGLPRPPITWVDNGVAQEAAHLALLGQEDEPRPPTRSYGTMSPSGPRAESMDALIAGLERGLLVTRFWYIRPRRAADGDGDRADARRRVPRRERARSSAR